MRTNSFPLPLLRAVSRGGRRKGGKGRVWEEQEDELTFSDTSPGPGSVTFPQYSEQSSDIDISLLTSQIGKVEFKE